MKSLWKWMPVIALAMVVAAPLSAQGWLGPRGGAAWGAGPGWAAAAQNPPAPAALKEALGLSDQQMQQLLDLRKQTAEANRTVVEQIRSKRLELAALMQSANPDPAKAGQLMVDIKKLEDQRKARVEEFRTRALALLTAEQKQKLADLEKALTLAPAARQAAGLGLIAPPQRGAGLAVRPGRMMPLRGMRRAARAGARI
jgi:Spy/CpxP family protein refolding chaperone